MMNKYDFSTVIDRRNTGSAKWNDMENYDISGKNIVPLSNAEMEFRNAPEIICGLQDYLSTAVLSYYEPMPSYFDAVKNWFIRRHGLTLEQEWIVPSNSLHTAVSTCIRAYTKPGEGVLYMEPVWPGFFAAEENGRTQVSVPLLHSGNSYTIDYDAFEKAASVPSNTLLLFCSPHNPVGRVWRKEELEQVVDICHRHHVILISDEIHCDLVLPGHIHRPMISISDIARENTVMLSGCSKAFNLAGLDCANIIIPNKELRKKYVQTKNQSGMIRPNMLGLLATKLALTKGEEWLNQCIRVLEGNYRLVKLFLEQRLPMISCTELEGTYLMWLDMRKLNLPVTELEERLMSEASLFLDAGYYFGANGNGFERVNIAVPESVMLFAMERLEKWIKSL